MQTVKNTQQKVFKASKENHHHAQWNISVITNFSSETMKAGRQWNGISKCERQNYLPRIFFQPRILYPTNLPSKMKEKLRDTQINNFEETALKKC